MPRSPSFRQPLSVADVLRLQRAGGNRAVTAALGPQVGATVRDGAVVQRDEDLDYRGPSRGHPAIIDTEEDLDDDDDYDDGDGDHAPGPAPTLGDFLSGPITAAEARLAREAAEARARAEREAELVRKAELEAEARRKEQEQEAERARALEEERRRAEERAEQERAAEQERLRREAERLAEEQRQAEEAAREAAKAEQEAHEAAKRLQDAAKAEAKEQGLRDELDGILSTGNLLGSTTAEEYADLLNRLSTLKTARNRTGSNRNAKRAATRAKESFDDAVATVRKRLAANVKAAQEAAARQQLGVDFQADRQALLTEVDNSSVSAGAKAVLRAVLAAHTLASGFDATVDKNLPPRDVIEAHAEWWRLYHNAARRRTMVVIKKVNNPGYRDTVIHWKERGPQWECTRNFIATIAGHTSNVHVQPRGGRPRKKASHSRPPDPLG